MDSVFRLPILTVSLETVRALVGVEDGVIRVDIQVSLMLPLGSKVASLRLLMGSRLMAGTMPAEAEVRRVANVMMVKRMLMDVSI